MSKLPQVTRVDLTDHDRALIILMADVAGTLVSMRHGLPVTPGDHDRVRILSLRPGDVSRLLIKLNKERIHPLIEIEGAFMDALEENVFRSNLKRIKDTLEAATLRQPEGAAKSALRRDMAWLLEELEKRL